MSRIRHELVTRFWRGRDPFLDLPIDLREVDLNGWPGEHGYLIDAVRALRPRLVVEVGAGKGGSAIVMARELKLLGADAVVVAVDTFLGDSMSWEVDSAFDDLGYEAGRSTLYPRFMNNVLRFGAGNYVLPLTMDANTAAVLFSHGGLHPNLVHLDAATDPHAALAHLGAWWSLLAPGGMLIGGGYEGPLGAELRRPYDDFFRSQGVTVEHENGKCRATKPAPAAAVPAGEPAPLAAKPEAPAETHGAGNGADGDTLSRRATGSFKLGGRPVQLRGEGEGAPN